MQDETTTGYGNRPDKEKVTGHPLMASFTLGELNEKRIPSDHPRYYYCQRHRDTLGMRWTIRTR